MAERARKTVCVRGHLLTGDNLYIRKHGYRKCKACAKEDQRKTNIKKRRITEAKGTAHTRFADYWNDPAEIRRLSEGK